MQRHGHDRIEAAVAQTLQHQRHGEPLYDAGVAAVFEGVDDLLADALVLQGRPRALETEVDVLALLAHERREGSGQPATPADRAAHHRKRFETGAAEYIARPPLTADAALGMSHGTQRGSCFSRLR